MENLPQVISSRDRFTGRVFTVRTERLRYDDGAEHEVDVVVHGPSAAVIALTEHDELVLVRQYRHPVRRELWEIPAGRLDPGEDPVDGALRELGEETGYRAASARSLGAVAMSPGFCDELIHFVLAVGLRPGEQMLDEDERITVASFSADRAKNLMETGQIADAKSLLALQWFLGNRGELVGSRADN
ncbi:MAG TPA: NUDIX hydrolase [Candidatus Aquilonibacter sp.]|nr:NUDIX hydrolase [Candidatus Aquilonibacter sp.]